MKYFKKGLEIHAYNLDGSQDHCISRDMIPLTPEELDRIINPDDHLSVEEKRKNYLASLKPLSRRQFKLVLLNNNLLDQVEMAINSIPDATLRMRAKIEYEDAVSFERLNPTLNQLYGLMGLKESQVDALWEDGLKL